MNKRKPLALCIIARRFDHAKLIAEQEAPGQRFAYIDDPAKLLGVGSDVTIIVEISRELPPAQREAERLALYRRMKVRRLNLDRDLK